MPPTATLGFSMEALPGTQTRRGDYSALSDAAADGDPLLPSGRQGLYATDRPARDRPWLYAYAACLVAAFVGGIVAFARRNKHYAELTSLDTLTNPASCPLSYPGRRRSLLDDGEVDPATMFEIETFFGYAATWLMVSMAGSVALGLGFVALLRVRPALFVHTALGFQLCLLFVGGTGSLASGSDGLAPGLVCFLGLGILGLFYFVCRSKIVLVSKLLGIAGQGLFANWGLIFMAIGMQFVFALLIIPLALTMIAASRNGGIAFNPARDTNMAECVDATGYGVACCVWQPEPWVPVFHAFGSIMVTWTVLLKYEIKLFTVAGAISRWYFTPVSALGQHNAVDKSGRFVLSPTRRAIAGSNTLTALGHAMGPGLGTCCCGSFILTLVTLLRKLARNSQNGNGNGGLLAAIAGCLLQCLAAVLEYLTKFVTVRAAITGEAFFTAGRSVVDLLRRNFMDAYSVWWLPPFVLQACALISAFAWAMLLSLTSLPFWASKYAAEAGGTADVALGIISFFMAWIVLAYFCSLLLNVVDTVFVCVAMDRDAAEVTRADIVEVVSQLPSVKQVAVEQPGGEVVIGQADRREQAQSLLPQQGRATAV